MLKSILPTPDDGTERRKIHIAIRQMAKVLRAYNLDYSQVVLEADALMDALIKRDEQLAAAAAEIERLNLVIKSQQRTIDDVEKTLKRFGWLTPGVGD